MAPRSLLIALAVVGVLCSIAVLLARRWKLQVFPSWLASLSWPVGASLAFYYIHSAWPPVPWSTAALESEPWESVVYAMVAMGLVWPCIRLSTERWPTLCMLSALAMTCVPLLAALCTAERFSQLAVGNTPWALASLLAVGLNWSAIQHMNANGGGRWNLWIVVGQSLAIAGIIMTCYGRFGEWATVAGLCLAVVALARVFVSDADGTWSASVAVPALALNCVLFMHVREYRSNPMPLWFVPLPYLMPAMVAGIDIAWSQRLHPILRVVVAGVATAILAGACIGIILALNGPSEW